jgi:hypothetical protein
MKRSAAVFALTSFLSCFVLLTRQATEDSAPSHAVTHDAVPSIGSRPEYKHAVVRSGVYSSEEAKSAVRTDAAVRSHYSDINVAKLRLDHSSGGAMYVSYRKDNRVYWTSKPVRLLKGEPVVTDGIHFVRARCGNRLSETPQKPTETTGTGRQFTTPMEEELEQSLSRIQSEVVVPTALDLPPSGYVAYSSQPDGLLASRSRTGLDGTENLRAGVSSSAAGLMVGGLGYPSEKSRVFEPVTRLTITDELPNRGQEIPNETPEPSTFVTACAAVLVIIHRRHAHRSARPDSLC